LLIILSHGAGAHAHDCLRSIPTTTAAIRAVGFHDPHVCLQWVECSGGGCSIAQGSARSSCRDGSCCQSASAMACPARALHITPHRHAEKATQAQCELAHCTTEWQLVVVRQDVDTLLVHAGDGVYNIHRLLWRLLWWAPDGVRATWVWVPATWVRWIRALAFSTSRLRSRSGVSRVKVGERTCLCATSGGNLFTLDIEIKA
jgi:hypothetical protein